MIPGLRKATDSAIKPASLCGLGVGLFTANEAAVAMTATVCCKFASFFLNLERATLKSSDMISFFFF